MKSARTKHERRALLCLPSPLWLAVMATLLTLGGAAPARALTTITSSQTISTYIGGDVEVDGNDTVVTIGSGGSIGGRLSINDSSTVNLSGGSIGVDGVPAFSYTVYANGTSILNVFSGLIIDAVSANSSSTINVSGGSITQDVVGFDSSTINVSGGSIGLTVTADGGSTANITGGSMEAATAYGSSTVNLSGGSIIGGGADVVAGGSGTLNVFGCNLALGAGSPDLRQLTGTLADGTTIDVPALISGFSQGQIVLHNGMPVFGNCPTTSPTAVATCQPGGSIGAVVTYPALTATDNCSTPTIGYSQASGTVFPAGSTPVTVTATDAAGKMGTCSFLVTVRCAWSGVLQPINADGSSVFKAGSTLPVMFALTGASACITNLAATLSCVKVGDTQTAPVNEAVSTSAATTGNLFRYTGGQYLFNWSTKGLASGLYELHIDLGDGVTHTVHVGLK